MMKFNARQSAKVPDSKLPDGSLGGSLEMEIIDLIQNNPDATAAQMSQETGTEFRTVYRALDK